MLFFFYPNVSTIYWMECWSCWPVCLECLWCGFALQSLMFISHYVLFIRQDLDSEGPVPPYPHYIPEHPSQSPFNKLHDYLLLFSKIFFEILNPVLFALLLLWLKFLFLSFLAFLLILSIIPCSSSLASGVLLCLVNCIPFLRQKCRGSVGQETPATSSYSTGAFSLVITTIVA